jgi:hypothetical protein
MLTLMRFAVLVFLVLAIPAHAGQATTLRKLVEQIAVSFPRNELRACAVAHPDQAERFNASAARFSERIDGLLTEMTAVQASLSEPVPAEFLDFQLGMAAMDDTDFRTRTLQECRNRIQEFDALQDTELKAGMSETAESLSSMIRQYRKDMERVLGTEPSD